MKKQAKKLAAMSIFLTGALCVSGCAAGGSESTSLSILVTSNGQADDEAWKSVVADFEDANPGVKVTFESTNTTDYATILKTRMQGGAGPDLYTYDGNVTAEFIESGFAMDVSQTSYFASLSENSQQFPLQSSPKEGAAYSVPLTQSANGIIYNTTLFEEAGIDAVPTTYDEFVVACQKLLDAGVTPLAMSARDDWWPQFVIYYAVAQHVFAADPDLNDKLLSGDATFSENEGWARVLEIYAELKPFYMPDPLGTDQASAQSAFLQGKVAMFPAPWILSEVRKTDLDVGYFNFPTTDDPDDSVIWGAPQSSIGVNPSNGAEELAGQFLDFMFSDEEYTKYLNATSAFPTRDGISLSEEEPLNPIMLAAWEGKIFVPTPLPPGSTVQAALLPALQDYLAEKKTADEVLAAMDKALEEDR